MNNNRNNSKQKPTTPPITESIKSFHQLNNNDRYTFSYNQRLSEKEQQMNNKIKDLPLWIKTLLYSVVFLIETLIQCFLVLLIVTVVVVWTDSPIFIEKCEMGEMDEMGNVSPSSPEK